MKNVLKMALLASTLMTATTAIAKPGKTGDGPPTKADPIPAHCSLGKVALNVFDGCPNEATLCSGLMSRSLVGKESRDFNQSPHLDLGAHRQALQNCLVKFEREVLGN